jgi:hypothetical protein
MNTADGGLSLLRDRGGRRGLSGVVEFSSRRHVTPSGGAIRDLEVRAKTISKLPRETCRENKVTPLQG